VSFLVNEAIKVYINAETIEYLLKCITDLEANDSEKFICHLEMLFKQSNLPELNNLSSFMELFIIA
jgi:hypothetical protein